MAQFNDARNARLFGLLMAVTLISGILLRATSYTQPIVLAESDCGAVFTSISPPLNDLGSNEYIHPVTGATGETGGLYAGGSNERPTGHENAGITIANQITPLDSNGQPDPTNGKIVMISIGMSNSFQEFGAFVDLAASDPSLNPQLTIINTAQPGMASDEWVTLPDFPGDTSNAWGRVVMILENQHNIPPEQVQIVWVKLAQRGFGDFPTKPQSLQTDLEIIARHTKTIFPNAKLAYYASRTRAYDYAWDSGPHLSPEPDAFETGFSVKWLIDKQIDGDATLNYNIANGAVVAPYLSWGAYIWIDGLNPRSDGLVWTQDDVGPDCVHPSEQGKQKVAAQLLTFFKNDTTTAPWFINADFPTATPTPIISTPTMTASPSPTTHLTPTPSVTPNTNTPTPAGTTPAGTTPATSTPLATPTLTPTPNTSLFYMPIIFGKKSREQ